MLPKEDILSGIVIVDSEEVFLVKGRPKLSPNKGWNERAIEGCNGGNKKGKEVRQSPGKTI